jgi:hypothetical protein
METSVRAALPTPARVGELARDRLGPALGTTALPFILVLYLALNGGGYDTVLRSEVGVAVWWILLLGALVGVLPRARITTAGWAALGLLGAFAVWTGLAIGWSDSAERSVVELARVATYVGVVGLALAAQGRDGLRRTAGAVGAAIAVVGVLALLSRLHPSWFPANETARFLPSVAARLNYPLNYWNGLAALIGVGLPLILVIAAEGRTLVGRALAAAAAPAMALAAFYTFSRGGAIEVAVGLLALLALYPRRLALLPTLGLAVAGSGLLIAAATQRDALENHPLAAAAGTQGDQMLAVALIVCAGVALVQVAIALAARHGLAPRVRLSGRAAGSAALVVVLAGVAIALAAGLPGTLSDRWQEFKSPTAVVATSGTQRFESASGNGRYQYWSAAKDGFQSEPLDGIGPGTFEYWWAQHGSIPGFVRDAHSLYFETLAELGAVGLALLLAALAVPVVAGLRRIRRARLEERYWLAAAGGAFAAFLVGAGIDWLWELAVLPVAFLLLAAAILGGGGSTDDLSVARRPAPSIPFRVGVAAIAIVALAAIAIPLAGTAKVRDSQLAIRDRNPGAALSSARDAVSVQPYSASASLQEALVLELQGDLNGAAAAATDATSDEPTDWRTWLMLSRIEAERGDARASAADYRRARSLNPRSPIFAQ